MNGHCSTCELEPVCGYPYKPCDCCNQRKFRPKANEQPKAQVIQFPVGESKPPVQGMQS